MNLELITAKSIITGNPVALSATDNGELFTASAFQIPAYDTLVESSSTLTTAGGTLTFFRGGPSGTQVAQLTITIGGDGSRTIQRTA